MTRAVPRAKTNGLMGILQQVRSHSTGKRVSIGDILETLETRGFGPLLLIPTIFIMLPTGAIPGVPDIGALFMILVAGQMLVGRDAPWIPKRLKKISIPSKKLDGAMKKAAPAIRKVDGMTRKRATIFTAPAFQKFAAILIILQSVLVIAIGMIPFLPDLLVAPIFLLALGFTARDGLLSVIGMSLLVMTGAGAVVAVL